MKTILWTFTLIFFFSALNADTGNCIKYKAKFELRNGKSVEGYFFYGAYDSLTFKFTDRTFPAFVDKLFEQGRDTLFLYLKIQLLKYPTLPPSGDGQYQYQAAIEKDILKLSKQDVVSSHFIEYFPPDEWNQPKEHWGFGCNGQSVIEELSQKEINLLQQKPIAQYLFPSTDQNLIYDYNLLSYNSKIGEEDLESLGERVQALSKLIKNCKEPNSYICFEREYLKIKKELEDKNVILFHWSGSN